MAKEPANAPVTPSLASALSTANNADNSNSNSSAVKPGFITELRFDPASRDRRDQKRRVVAVAGLPLGPNEVAVPNYTQTFTFVQSKTSDGYTIATFPDLTVEALAEACFRDVRCTGFNSVGQLKSFVRPASKWVVLDVSASNSVNTDPAQTGLYYQPQWYRFQPVPCPCDADVSLNFICSDPNSGDQYLGDPLTDRSCYRAKPAPVSHTCAPATCMKLAWTYPAFPACPSCGLNVTQTRTVTCNNKEGTRFPSKFCKLVEAKPATSLQCNAPIACEWKITEGACKAPCGRGFLSMNVTCSSPANRAESVADLFCAAVSKPSVLKRCKVKDCVWNTVPDGKCSYSCGEGNKALKATCIEPGKPEVVLADKQCANVRKPPVLIACNNRACAWESKATSPCSQPCGKGQQTVRNTCKDPLTGDVMPAKQCALAPPPSFQYCSIKSCVWQTSPNGACSNSCGSGVQQFNVTCRDPTTNHRVDDAQCKTLAPQALEAPCENNACGWRAIPVGKCSAPCGNGVQKFRVVCEDPITGKPQDEKMCGADKPKDSTPCRVRDCHWHRASKGACSAKCGPGIQSYRLSCVNPENGAKQKKSQCVNLVTPALSEPCELHACEWRAKNDGKCDQICGPGRQKRAISCHDPVTNDRVPSEHCLGKAPSLNTKCYRKACVWSTKPTSDCSASCGAGTQNVNVTCTDPRRRFVMPDSQCFDASRPGVTQACNLQECKWSATPASACSTTCGRGVQKLNVQCKDPVTAKVQANGQCDAAGKPKDEKSCYVKPCAWVADTPVGKCSQECGPGHVAVNITCQDSQAGVVYPDTLCSADNRPAPLQPCQIRECKWATNWSECGKQCGGDFQYTSLKCTTIDGTVVSNTQCKAAPATWKQCNTQACQDVPEAFLLYGFEDTGLQIDGAAIKNRVTDAKKIGLNGAVSGEGASSVAGRGGRGKAIKFTSSGDHTTGASVVIPSSPLLTTPAFTVSFWLQLLASPTPGRFYILVDNRGTQGGGEGFVLYLDPRDGLLYLNDAYSSELGKSHFADSGVAFPSDGAFHHVAVTYNGAKNKAGVVAWFIDGKQTSMVDAAHTFVFTVPTSAHTVHLRGSSDKYWRYLPLAMDDFAFFNYAIDTKQAQVLADPATPNTCEAGRHLTGGGCKKDRTAGDVLNARCKVGSPYDVAQCLQPLWGLNSCSNLGSSFPDAAADASTWSGTSWADVKATVAALAKKDVQPELVAKGAWGTCQSRSPSGLDLLCNHPAPFHTEVCLQALFLESGCSRKALGFPASASHPLAAQLNKLSWRDVKAKIQHIIKTDVRGGISEGQCHAKLAPGETQ